MSYSYQDSDAERQKVQKGTLLFQIWNANTHYTVVPPLIRPPYLPINCDHIKDVAFGERQN